MKPVKTLCIDLRRIDSSGVGAYINRVMPRIVERLCDVSIVGIGDRTRLLQLRRCVLLSNYSIVIASHCLARYISKKERVLLRCRDHNLWIRKTYLAALTAFVPRFASEFRDTWGTGAATAITLGLDPHVHPGVRPGAFGESYFNVLRSQMPINAATEPMSQFG